ncbi:MAG: hypothetical protein Kow0090_11570 [Myxococcota bacterium]
MRKKIIIGISLAITIGYLFVACLNGEEDTTGGSGAADDDDNNGGNGGGEVNCIADDECPDGKVCINGVCDVKECDTANDCGGEKVCEGGKCVEPTPPQNCESDDVCGEAKKCIEGFCRTPGCIVDGDCGTGFKCDTATWSCVEDKVGEGGACESHDKCNEGLACIESKCEKTCASDADCSDGLICRQVEFGISVCRESQGGCQVDSQCQSGEKCVNGKCVVDDSCKSDADCKTPGAEYCDVTVGECVECVTSPNCGTGKLCENNVCVPDPNSDVGPTDSGDDDDDDETCTSTADCVDPTKPICDAFNTGKCVQCLGDFDCQAGECCNATTHTCSSANCGSDVGPGDTGGTDGGSGAGQKCDPCVSDADCATGLKCTDTFLMGKMCGEGDPMAMLDCLGGGMDGGFP